MLIAHITATFPPYQGGTGNVSYYNARELVSRGHEVHIYTAACQGAPTYAEREGITIHRLPTLFRFGNAPFLPGLLSIRDFDIIHLHHPFIFGAEMIWVVSKLRKIPYVLTHHNDLIGDGYRRYLFDAYSAVSTRMIFGGAARFAVVSKDHAAHCRLSPIFLKRRLVIVEVPNGVDVELFNPGVDGTTIRQHYNIPNDAFVILFVGALDRAHHFKGVDYLIEAFALIPDHKALLMIVGDGDLRQQFEQLAALSGVADRVIFTGVVPNEELPPYYTAADIFVLPSFPPESFGIVLIEAMACGLPVIAHNIPGVRSVVDDKGNGLLMQPGNKAALVKSIEYLLADPEIRKDIGINARVKVEAKYTWSNAASKLLDIYDGIFQT